MLQPCPVAGASELRLPGAVVLRQEMIHGARCFFAISLTTSPVRVTHGADMTKTYSDTYLPFRPGLELGELIQRHADRIGVNRSEAVRQLLFERLRQLYPGHEHDPKRN